MRLNVNRHDVSMQINADDSANDVCEKTQCNFIKSVSHLKSLIDAIEGNGTHKGLNADHSVNGNLEGNANGSILKAVGVNIKVNGAVKGDNNISTRNTTKDNLNTEVVKRGPGRPKMDPATRLNNENNRKNAHNRDSKGMSSGEIKKESNGIIKEEVNDNQNKESKSQPNNFVINKQFMETDNELINN